MLEAALKNAQRAQEEYAARVSTAKEHIERCEKVLDELKNSTGDTSEEQKKLTEELDKWNTELTEAEAGQTAERGVLTNLAKPIDAVAAYMDELGISLTDNAGNVRSLSGLIEILHERFANLTEAEQAEYAAGLAGKEAMSGLLAIANASDADFQKLTGAITNCSGASYEMSQIRLDNLAGQITLFESAVDGLKLAVGEQLALVLRNIYEIGTNAFSWATEFVEENEWIVGVITGVAAALEELLAVEEKSAAQKEAIKKMIDELNESVPGPALAYDEMGESI